MEGSKVVESLTEKTSHFTSSTLAHKFGHERALRRYDDSDVMPIYAVDGVPNIFCQIRRLSGKLKEVWWLSQENCHNSHTYVLLNCEEMKCFERQICVLIFIIGRL